MVTLVLKHLKYVIPINDTNLARYLGERLGPDAILLFPDHDQIQRTGSSGREPKPVGVDIQRY
jgi:hypothetical protein